MTYANSNTATTTPHIAFALISTHHLIAPIQDNNPDEVHYVPHYCLLKDPLSSSNPREVEDKGGQGRDPAMHGTNLFRSKRISMCTCQTLRSIDDSFAGRMLRPSRAATAGKTGVLRFPSMRACILPATPTLRKQCGAAFGWTSGSTFISRRTLGSVRLLLSTPLVQLRAA